MELPDYQQPEVYQLIREMALALKAPPTEPQYEIYADKILAAVEQRLKDNPHLRLERTLH